MNKVFLGLSMMCLLLFTSALAFAEPMYGVLMVVKGSVKVTTASKQTIDAKVGGKVYEGDSILTAADARAKIVMADRNVINVNPDTQVVIAKYENDAASGKKNVELNLLKGKVRNNVEQTYDGEKSKFLIKTPTAVAGVRGTQFLASFDVKTRMTSVVTFKGSVTLASVGPAGKIIGTPVTIKKGEMTQSAPDKAPEPPKAVPKEDMKKMDGESSASLQNKEAPADAGANANNGGEQKREVASPDDGQSMIGNEPPETVVFNDPRSEPTPPPPQPTPVPTPATTPPIAAVPQGPTKVYIQPVPQN